MSTAPENLQKTNSDYFTSDLKKKITFSLKRSSRWIIFYIFFIFNIFMNIDNGTINCASEEIENLFFNKTDNQTSTDTNNNKEMGLFKCIVFLGTTFGSIISAFIINKISRKYFLISSAFLNGVCLLLFYFIFNNFYVYLFLRFCNGIFQSFVSIYLPAWCNQFGIQERKTIMLGLVQIGVPLGVVIGYGITVLCLSFFKPETQVNTGWKATYCIQALGLWIIVVVILFIPDKYFSARTQQVLVKDENKQNKEEKEEKEDSKNENSNTKMERTESEFHNVELSKSRIKKKHNNCFKEMLSVIRQPIFILCSVTLAILFYILTVVQFQGTEYMLKALGATNLTQTLTCFAIICLTSPTFGILIGSSIINYQGGYETKNSILICCISSFLSALSTIPAPFATNIYTFTLCLWFVLFFGGAIVPPINGIIMSSIPKELVGTANSIVIMICNLLGYLPAPFLYGIMKDYFGKNKYTEKEQEKSTMRISLWFSGIGVVLLIVATIVRYKKFDEMYAEKNITEEMIGKARKNRKSNTHTSHNRAYIIQYMNGLVSGFDDAIEVISNSDIAKITEEISEDNESSGRIINEGDNQDNEDLDTNKFKLMEDSDMK